MTSELLFEDGDLIEFTWPFEGDAEVDGPMRVRAVVLGFRVDEQARVSVKMRMGRMAPVGEIRGSEGAITDLNVSAEPRVEAIKLSYLLGGEAGLELIRRGNSVHSFDPYFTDGESF